MQPSEHNPFFEREMLLGRLYVFHGSFPLRAIIPVCSDHQLSSEAVKAGLELLEEEGLIVKTKAPGGARCTLWFEDVDRWRAEAYGRKSLDPIRDRHLKYFITY